MTEVSPLQTFYKAEENHQNFYNLNTSHGYCKAMIKPKIGKLKDLFSKYIDSAKLWWQIQSCLVLRLIFSLYWSSLHFRLSFLSPSDLLYGIFGQIFVADESFFFLIQFSFNLGDQILRNPKLSQSREEHDFLELGIVPHWKRRFCFLNLAVLLECAQRY